MKIESLFVHTVAMTAISSRRGLLSGCSTFLTSSGNAGASEELGYVQNVALRSHCLAYAVAGIPLNDEKSGMLYGNHIYIVSYVIYYKKEQQ